MTGPLNGDNDALENLIRAAVAEFEWWREWLAAGDWAQPGAEETPSR